MSNVFLSAASTAPGEDNILLEKPGYESVLFPSHRKRLVPQALLLFNPLPNRNTREERQGIITFKRLHFTALFPLEGP